MEQENHNDRKKILIVNWKWGFSERYKSWDHLNEIMLQKHRGFLEEIERGRGHFFQEFEVQTSVFCPDALVVATSIYVEGEATRQLLFNLLDQYVSDAHRVLLLMHRPNAPQEETLHQIWDRYPDPQLFRCAYFEGGRDYIYYPVQHSGLLDDVGDFYQDEEIRVLDETDSIVLQPYFDRVWKYYEGDFEQKVLTLKEDLFDVLFPVFINEQKTVLQQELIQLLQHDHAKLLWPRLNSFMGHHLKQHDLQPDDFEQRKAIKSEQMQLAGFEKKDRRSYSFDDSVIYLESHPHSLEAQFYRETRHHCQSLFFANDREKVPKNELRELANKFDLLVKVIQGMIN